MTLCQKLPMHIFDSIILENPSNSTIPQDYLNEKSDLKSLHDIRDCKAYRAFVKLIGGTSDITENGYDILAT